MKNIKTYTPPLAEIVNIAVEQGFALSGTEGQAGGDTDGIEGGED